MARVIAAALVVGAVAAATAAVALAAQSPNELRTAIFAAARAQRSVHYVNAGVGNAGVGTVSIRMSCDVTADRGIQRIAFTKHGRTGHVTVLVAHRTAYVRGDAFTLHGYMEFTSAQSSRYAGRWISIPHSASSYPTVSAGVTLPSLLRVLYPKGEAVRVVGKVGGRQVVGLRKHARHAGVGYTETLWAKARGRPLPVEDYSVAPSKGYWQRVTLSRWNEPVQVSAPAHAVPISTVSAH